jgi:hypothetical protein
MLAALFIFSNITFSMDPEKIADPAVEQFKALIEKELGQAKNFHEFTLIARELNKKMRLANIRLYAYLYGPETEEKKRRHEQHMQMSNYLKDRIARERERYNASKIKAAKNEAEIHSD